MFGHRRGNNLPDIHGTRTSPRRFQIRGQTRFRNPDTTRMRSFQRNGLVSNSNIRRLEPLERSALDHSLDTQGCSPCVDRVRTPHNIVGFRRKACHCRRCRKKSGQSNSGTDRLRKLCGRGGVVSATALRLPVCVRFQVRSSEICNDSFGD